MTVDASFFESKSVQFAANVLRNQPSILRSRAELEYMLAAIVRRQTTDEKASLIAKICAHSGISDEAKEELCAAIDAESVNLKCSTTGAVRSYYVFFATILADALDLVYTRAAMNGETSRAQRLLKKVQASLSLSADDMELVTLLFFYKQGLGIFEDAFNCGYIWDEKNFAKYVGSFLNVPSTEVQRIYGKNAPLFQLGFVAISNANSPLEVNSDLIDYLCGAKGEIDFEEAIFESIDIGSSAIRPINVQDAEWDLLKSILGGSMGANILFHGLPGCGKTSLAKALSRDLGLNIISVANPEDGDQKRRISNLLCAMTIAKTCENKVVLVDEADRLLGTGFNWMLYGDKLDKGWLNKFLEGSKVKIIWISNSIARMESSSLRRFAYVMEFQPYSRKQRHLVWESLVSSLPMLSSALSKSDLDDLSAAYELQPAHLADSARRIANLGLPPEKVRPAIEQCLSGYLSQSTKRQAQRKRQWSSLSANHTADGLNTDCDMEELAQTLQAFVDAIENKRENMPIRNMNVLFSGPPGTGKTEYAKYLATKLKRDLLMKTASELQSKWVGETEKNIGRAFDEAEDDQAVLFVDEADSFLWPRARAQQSWQVSEVNEFLCRMENFRGILICASNNIELFDDAAVRRFNFKIRFDWLNPSGKLHFFSKLLGPLIQDFAISTVPVAHRHRLEKIPALAPGDFKVVFQKNALLPSNSITMDKLIDDLESESRYKSATEPQIGFSRT